MVNVNTTFIKKVLIISGISALALTDMAAALVYINADESIFIGDAINSHIA